MAKETFDCSEYLRESPPLPKGIGGDGTVRVCMRIKYHTQFGEVMCVSGSVSALGAWKTEEDKAVNLSYIHDGVWEGNLVLPYNEDGEFFYKYFIRRSDGSDYWEYGENRRLRFSPSRSNSMTYEDSWRSQGDPSSALLTDAFQKVIFRRNSTFTPTLTPQDCTVRIQLRAPRISDDCVMCVFGNTVELGQWKTEEAVRMSDADFPLWSIDIPITANNKEQLIEYKYVILDAKTRKPCTFEEGFNRMIRITARKGETLVRTDEGFRYPVGLYKAAGVAVPVFSLRSEKGLGVGEFSDIIPLVDWAAGVGLRLIQVLPINDTIASHSWVDTYPYSAISVHALHPGYLNVNEMGAIKDTSLAKELKIERERLNALPQIDYESVMAIKFKCFRHLYSLAKATLDQDKEYQFFLSENSEWVYPYAVFSYMRDIYSTVDFRWWPRMSVFSREEVMKVVDGKSGVAGDSDGAGLYLYLQYHLARQMSAAVSYARSKRIVLKGDLPIGIYRFSVDAWMAPHLFNMNCQTGAPPDAFAVEGQNWGFPTYNWHVMAQDNFSWWRSRLTTMAKYFDAYRIDHILGFFRIWEIPYSSIQGLLGQFSPAHSISIDELRGRGVHFDYNRLCKPYIRGHLLHNFVGAENVEKVTKEFLNTTAHNCFDFKPQFDTQRKIVEYIQWQVKLCPSDKEYYERIRPGLIGLIEEVIFLEAPFSHHNSFTPRISLQHTFSFRELDWSQQNAINEVYIHYFYHRQEQLWSSQAMQKLPAIVNATNMLVCGEDLGMVPACVGPILEQLGILSLNIQRMPKDPKKKFFHPGDSSYLSVASTSSHDLSTMRAWWQENPEETRQFFREILGHKDDCPFFCEDWVAKEIILQHLFCPAMWAIFPVQDLLAIDTKLRLPVPELERINVPANPRHYWRFRLHLSIEELQKSQEFNSQLTEMLDKTGRNTKY